jgi:hypothetical protein
LKPNWRNRNKSVRSKHKIDWFWRMKSLQKRRHRSRLKNSISRIYQRRWICGSQWPISFRKISKSISLLQPRPKFYITRIKQGRLWSSRKRKRTRKTSFYSWMSRSKLSRKLPPRTRETLMIWWNNKHWQLSRPRKRLLG